MKCCQVDTVCGYTLEDGIKFVGIATIVISSIALISSIVNIRHMANSDVVIRTVTISSVDLLFGLFSGTMSVYQIVISLLLLWHIKVSDGDIFACTLWYVSHISIVTLYTMFFIGRTVACIAAQDYMHIVFTVIAGILYQGVFIYFCIIVNSYSNTVTRVMIYY